MVAVMRVLKPEEFKTFQQICGLSQASLKKTLSAFLKSKYGKKNVIEEKEYLCAIGQIPIALVAHMDTVFPKPAKDIFYDKEKNVIWSPSGLGADDRAGVFSILEIIKRGFLPHIIFTTDEEIGCVGGTILSYEECPFKDLKYIIELDRRGTNDCVFYDCDNPDFTEYVSKFGFVEAIGSFSDISMICEGWGIAGVNLSIGYRDEHSVSETLYVNAMLSTIDKVCTMLSEKEIPYFKFIPSVYAYSYGSYDYGYHGSTKWYKPIMESHHDNTHCWLCESEFKPEDMIPVKLRNRQTKPFCIDCIVDNVEWCGYCGEAYEPHENDTTGLCYDCRKELGLVTY